MPILGEKTSPETRAKISASRMGQAVSTEAKAKMSVSQSAPLGSTLISAKGYRWVKTEDGWGIEHRLVMGLETGDGLVVHHEDEDRLNNHPSNLLVMTGGEHTALHNKGRYGV